MSRCHTLAGKCHCFSHDTVKWMPMRRLPRRLPIPEDERVKLFPTYMATWRNPPLNCRRTSINTQWWELGSMKMEGGEPFSLSCQITLCQNRESDSRKHLMSGLGHTRRPPTLRPDSFAFLDILVNTRVTIGFPFKCECMQCILIERVFYSWAGLLWCRPRRQRTLLLSDVTRALLTTPDKCGAAPVYHCPPSCPL